MTVFTSGGDARTFDFQTGDFQAGGVGFVPFAMGHCIQNTGTTRLRHLEMFKAPVYPDSSPAQPLALTPPELVRAHLSVDDVQQEQAACGGSGGLCATCVRLSTRNRWIGEQPHV